MAGIFIWRAIAALFVGLSTATFAQVAEDVDRPTEADAGEETICVGGPQWYPSLADSRTIATDPVPARFRALFESTAPCTRWALNVASLVEWHMASGNEQSVAAVLSFLESDYVRNVPAPAGYEQALSRAWRTARPDLRRALAVQQPEGLDYSVRHRFMERSRSIQRLEMLIHSRQNYLFLAEQYLRASEEFGSLPLLDKAEHFLNPLLRSARVLEPLERQLPAASILHINLQTFRTDDLQMRAAVQRARLVPSTDKLSRADAIVRAFEGPGYSEAARNAFSGGDSFCDFGHGRGGLDLVEAACRDDDGFQERVTNYWINRALLDVISGSDDRDSMRLAVRLLELEERDYRSGRCCYRNSEEDLLRLLLAGAERNARRVDGAVESLEIEDALEPWREALDDLQRAEELVAPHEAPGRWRRIAELWLALWAQADRFDRPDASSPRRRESPRHRRYAAYLRALIANLDAIAVGGAPDGS